jgi:hypothetical protein
VPRKILKGKIMNHHEEFSDFIGDRSRSAGDVADSLERSTAFIDKFFEKLEVESALSKGSKPMTKVERSEFVGLDRYSVSESDAAELARRRGLQPEALDELRDFAKSEIASVRANGITKGQLRASLGALRSILGRVQEHC